MYGHSAFCLGGNWSREGVRRRRGVIRRCSSPAARLSGNYRCDMGVGLVRSRYDHNRGASKSWPSKRADAAHYAQPLGRGGAGRGLGSATHCTAVSPSHRQLSARSEPDNSLGMRLGTDGACHEKNSPTDRATLRRRACRSPNRFRTHLAKKFR